MEKSKLDLKKVRLFLDMEQPQETAPEQEGRTSKNETKETSIIDRKLIVEDGRYLLRD
jgi:hypothetical protein